MRLGKKPMGPIEATFGVKGLDELVDYKPLPELTYVCPECGEDAKGVMAVMEHLKRHSGLPEWHPALNGPSFVACTEYALHSWDRR